MQTAFERGFIGPLRKALDLVDDKVLQTRGGTDLKLPPLTKRQRSIELLFVFLSILAYCLPFLDLGSLDRLPGNESEVFQSLDQLLSISIRQAGRFPLWNPYVFSGIPYAADPMLHAYNPFISVPVLLFGARDGFKIAVFLGFLIGALGMWWLGRLLRLGPVGRLWMALLYAVSGATMSRFFQGQYLLQMATGWLPLIIAALYGSLMTRRRRYIAAAALSLALLFLCGNAYYAYYMLYAIAILALVMVVRFSTQPLRPRIELARVYVLLLIGVLAAGLIAAQLLPLAGFWNRISKQTDQSLQGSQSIRQVFLDLVSTDARRPDAIATLPPEEFYAYIGVAPLILLVFLPLAWRKANRRILLYFLLLAVFALLWIDMRDMPWKVLFENIPFLYQFRYPTRMLVLETLSLAVLSGMAADGVWRVLESLAASLGKSRLRYLPIALSYLLAAALVGAVISVAAAHRQDLQPQKYYPPPDIVLGWLKQQDNGTYYVAAPNGWHEAIFANQLRYSNSWYHFNEVRWLDGRINKRDVQATPKYEIVGNDAPMPQGSVIYRQFDQHTIYEHPDALSFAFTVPTTTLATPAADGAQLRRSDTSPVDPYTPNTDSIEAIVNGNANETLVVLGALTPGWTLTIDDRSMPVLNVSGYMAAAVLPGTHRYLFRYQPTSVPIGWGISLLFLIVTLALGASDMAFSWRAALERIRAADWRGWAEGLGRRRPIPAPGLPAPDQSTTIWDRWVYWTRRLRGLPASLLNGAISSATWAGVLFTAAAGIYLFAVLYRNADFPIYFFTDEAVHMNQAADLLLHGFRNSQHEFLPTYFNIGTMFSLNSLSVYLQVIPYLLFGKSVAVTRGVSGLVTALGAVAAALTLRNVFRVRQYWLAILLLIASPAWFLHGRTAFEYAELAAFYSIFIYCYLEYRSGKPRWLFAAVLAGAAVFYTHGLGQVLIGVTSLVLFLVDIRFHFRAENRRTLWMAIGLAVLLAIPYVRYMVAYPDVTAGEISQRGSYVLDSSLTLLQKIGHFAYEYFHGLSPLYWYMPNNYDLVRHVMKGYGHIWIATLPFALLGLYLGFRNFSDPKYRTLIITLLTAPVPAAIVAVGIIRELWLMVPVALLTALGLVQCIAWLTAKIRMGALLAPVLVFAALAGHSLVMLNDALTNGPTWYQDYTLYGMQYGGRQVFAQNILRGLRSDPNVHYVVSPNWANGTDQLLFFFIPPQYQDRVTFGTVDDYMNSWHEITPDTVLVALPNEYQQAQSSPLFSKVDVIKTVPEPNGQAGFYFVHLAYAPDVASVFAQLEAERRQPSTGQVTVEGDPATITYSKIEAGQPSDMFDGNLQSLVRGVEANPFIVDLVFQKPLPMSGLSADFGHMSVRVNVSLYVNEEDTPMQFQDTVMNPPGEPHAEISFGASYPVTHIHIEITNLDVGPGSAAKIHIREIRFNQ